MSFTHHLREGETNQETQRFRVSQLNERSSYGGNEVLGRELRVPRGSVALRNRGPHEMEMLNSVSQRERDTKSRGLSRVSEYPEQMGLGQETQEALYS